MSSGTERNTSSIEPIRRFTATPTALRINPRITPSAVPEATAPFQLSEAVRADYEAAIDMLEDCVQECLIAIHKARHTYDPGRPFRPWMFTLVRHRMIDLLRKRNCRIQTAAGSEHAELDLGDPDHILRLIDGVRVLESLQPDYREAVTLTKYAGMTTLEASRWLGISESAIKARLRRGLSAIQRQLETEESMA